MEEQRPPIPGMIESAVREPGLQAAAQLVAHGAEGFQPLFGGAFHGGGGYH